MQTATQPLQKVAIQRARTDYSFVNWVRFVAMLSIVYEHCLDLHVPGDISQHFNANVHFVQNSSQTQAMPWIVQPMKFGTICFFIISGYLLGKHLSINTLPWPYYRRRLKIVGIPYLIAATGFFLINIHIYGVLRGRYNAAMWTLDYLWTSFQSTILFSSFWFILSFLIALGLFLLFWRKSGKPIFGWFTAAIAVFYGVNIYLGWVEERHNLAMPAYLFYLWLGVWLSRHDQIVAYIQHIPNSWLIGTVLLLLCLAVLESRYLEQLNSISPFNTVRLSNQLYSVAVFALLLRNDFSNRLKWLHPRSESFGIYLYHLYIVMAVTFLSIQYKVLLYQSTFSGLDLAEVTIVRWICIYSFTLLFVKLVNLTRFKWLFGN